VWKLEQRRVDEEFDKVTPQEHRELRAAETGLAVVRMYRVEYARWEQDADEPEQLGTLAVVWEVLECDCEDCDGFESVADALGDVLDDWDVHATSVWEASASPWEPGDETVWVEATETYLYETDTRYRYSLHVEGVTPEIQAEVFAAVGVKQ
jgi:hypothetical protein